VKSSPHSTDYFYERKRQIFFFYAASHISNYILYSKLFLPHTQFARQLKQTLMFPQEKSQLTHYTWLLTRVGRCPLQQTALLTPLLVFSLPNPSAPHTNSGAI